ncbi:MAG TPA: iron chelate uptake ABC transporter family permease subunit [Thermomicrobiales bacterium]|nr:iron chelate uptake ABC transporter family permease subunit [Thermomicrobiales bacterium]
MTPTYTAPFDKRLIGALVVILALSFASITIGVYDLSFSSILTRDEDFESSLVFMASRIPRTVAIILVGMSMGVAGMLMQMLSRNKFVSPTTAGTTESASLGILTITLLAPGASLPVKIIVATLFALAGTALFLLILRQVPLRSPLVVPLVGIMLGGVIASVTSFFAYRYDLLQSLAAWTGGDFSRVLRGRYELLWLSGGLTLLAFVAADRFTVAGMGDAFSTNLGLNYRRVLVFGLVLVSVVTAVNVVTVGTIPFLGLIVPNVVSIVMGDNARRAVPWVAVFGAVFLLACDIFGRVVRYPYEVPIGTVVGVIGSALFLYMLLGRSQRVG